MINFQIYDILQRLNSVLDETNKSCAVGASEENRSRNRSDSVIPFDRNRVILTPIGKTLVSFYESTGEFN